MFERLGFITRPPPAGDQQAEAGNLNPDHSGNPLKVKASNAPAITTSTAHQKDDITLRSVPDRALYACTQRCEVIVFQNIIDKDSTLRRI